MNHIKAKLTVLEAKPMKVYTIFYKNKNGGDIHVETAIKTRNIWNTRTGKYICYGQEVVDYVIPCYCHNCNEISMLRRSDFDKDNEYEIWCEKCDTPLTVNYFHKD